MAVTPRIADVHCTKIVFQPGDRLMVRTRCRLEPEAKRRLEKMIRQWAGEDVNVLIYCPLDFTTEVIRCGITI